MLLIPIKNVEEKLFYKAHIPFSMVLPDYADTRGITLVLAHRCLSSVQHFNYVQLIGL